MICDLSEGEFAPSSDDGEASFKHISSECAAFLGQRVGLDWETFSEPPHGFDVARSPAELIVAGLFTLIAADVGKASDVVADESTPPWVGRESRSLKDTPRDNTDANLLWWHIVASRISRVSYRGDASGVDLALEDGALIVNDLTSIWRDSGLAATPVEIAAALVHEAGHLSEPEHTWCNFAESGGPLRACDARGDATLGAQATWLHGWLENSAPVAGAGLVSYVVGSKEDTCLRILDQSSFVPCARWP